MTPAVPSTEIRGREYTLKPRMFPLDIREQFYTVTVTEHWRRLPREVVESPPEEIVKKKSLDMVLGNKDHGALFEQGGMDQMTSRSPFQPVPFCDSVFILVGHSG